MVSSDRQRRRSASSSVSAVIESAPSVFAPPHAASITHAYSDARLNDPRMFTLSMWRPTLS
jgi:hypothetical protein